MIGIVVVLNVIAILVAVIKKGPLWKFVLLFIALSILSFVLAERYVNSCGQDFCGIGQGIVGSLLSLGFALAAVLCAFQSKQSIK